MGRFVGGWKERAKLALIGSPLEGAARRVWQGLHGGGLPPADALTVRAIARSVRRGSNCIDVGAHAGDILEVLVAHAPDGTHYAFEPLPGYATALRRKYRRRANVRVFDCALGDAAGVAAFHHDRIDPAYSSLRPLPRRPGNRGAVDVIPVPQRRLDEVIPDGVPIHFIKIDVEGAELLVLRGAMRLLARHRPVVLFEFGRSAGEAYGTDPADVVNLFARLGMQISSLAGYVEGAAPLDRDGVHHQYRSGSNWYFVAHPDGR